MKTIAKVLRTIDEGIREIASELELDVDASHSVSDTRMATLSNLQEKMSQWCDSTEQLSHYRSTMSRIEKLQ